MRTRTFDKLVMVPSALHVRDQFLLRCSARLLPTNDKCIDHSNITTFQSTFALCSSLHLKITKLGSQFHIKHRNHFAIGHSLSAFAH